MTKTEKQHRLNFYVARAKISINEAEAALYDDCDINLADKYFTTALDFLRLCKLMSSTTTTNLTIVKFERLHVNLMNLKLQFTKTFKEFVKVAAKVHKAMLPNIDIFIAKASHNGYSHSVYCEKCFEVATEAFDTLHELHIEGLSYRVDTADLTSAV